MPLTKINTDQLQRVDLNKYTTLILVNGNYSDFSPSHYKNRAMDTSGGTLIAYQDAIKWLNDNKLIELVLKLASWRQRTFHSSNRETRAHKKSQVQYLKLN
jgi:hypothetical protein